MPIYSGAQAGPGPRGLGQAEPALVLSIYLVYLECNWKYLDMCLDIVLLYMYSNTCTMFFVVYRFKEEVVKILTEILLPYSSMFYS